MHKLIYLKSIYKFNLSLKGGPTSLVYLSNYKDQATFLGSTFTKMKFLSYCNTEQEPLYWCFVLAIDNAKIIKFFVSSLLDILNSNYYITVDIIIFLIIIMTCMFCILPFKD